MKRKSPRHVSSPKRTASKRATPARKRATAAPVTGPPLFHRERYYSMLVQIISCRKVIYSLVKELEGRRDDTSEVLPICQLLLTYVKRDETFLTDLAFHDYPDFDPPPCSYLNIKETPSGGPPADSI